MRIASTSLRTKLVLWIALVFLAIDVGLVTALSIARIETFRRELYEEVRDWASKISHNLVVLEPEWTVDQPAKPEELRFNLPVPSFDLVRYPCGVIVRNKGGEIVAQTGLLRPDLVPMTLLQSMVQGPVGEVRETLELDLTRTTIGSPRPHVVLTMPVFRIEPNRIEYVQVVAPRALVEPALSDFADLIILGVLIGGPIALLAAWVVAGRVVAPIEQLAQAARSVRPDRIGERIDVDPSSSEISALQGELNEALARLELGFRGQERFIGDVSHELRTPLAVLLAEAGLLRHGETDVERYRTFVDSTEEELRRLARLVDGFLRLTRVEMTREPLLREEVEVNDLVVDATRHVGGYARRGGVHLVPHIAPPDDEGDGPIVRGDPELLRTMLENLIRNAVRFSPHGAPVVIEVECEGAVVRVVVRDQGPGIPPENLERVFERFVRLEQHDGGQGGSGIGLAIARNVALLHRGTIWAGNAPTGGCVMTVELPRGGGEDDESTDLSPGALANGAAEGKESGSA